MKRLLVGIFLLVGVLNCASRPPRFPFWLTQEGKTPAFGHDRDFIRDNCVLVRRDDPSQVFRTAEELRAYARTLGATAIVIDKTDVAQRERMSFYLCETFPSEADPAAKKQP